MIWCYGSTLSSKRSPPHSILHTFILNALVVPVGMALQSRFPCRHVCGMFHSTNKRFYFLKESLLGHVSHEVQLGTEVNRTPPPHTHAPLRPTLSRAGVLALTYPTNPKNGIKSAQYKIGNDPEWIALAWFYSKGVMYTKQQWLSI